MGVGGLDKSDRERERGCWMDEDLEEKGKRVQKRGKQGGHKRSIQRVSGGSREERRWKGLVGGWREGL